MMTRRQTILTCAAGLTGFAGRMKAGRAEQVQISRVPQGGLQPQAAIDHDGVVHLLYYAGDPRKGDLFYAKSSGASFSQVLRVNSQPGSAIAMGTIRGGQLALSKDGRPHVAWNGSMKAEPPGPVNPDSGKPGAPMLYARLDDSGKAFEPQRNLMRHSFGLDGGGSIAADASGDIYVAWHGIGESEARGTGKEGEARRRVWIATSRDDGRSFAEETKAWPQETGACGCCGMKIFAGSRENVFALYRSATESVHRDIYLLVSRDKGKSFDGRLLHKWEINACPMSSMDFAENANLVAAAWETGGQVYWARIDKNSGRVSDPVAAPGEGKGRKHPRVAVNSKGEVLFAWTEGTGWQKGGSLAYQVYNADGQAVRETEHLPGVPAWSFGAVIARPDNRFSIFY